MEREEVEKIINKYKLIPGKLGRRILYCIENNMPIPSNDLPNHVTTHMINKLSRLYHKKARELGYQKRPRNFIFYQIIKEMIPEFSWTILKDINGKSSFCNVEIRSPRVKNLRPSLLSLLLERVSKEDDTLLHRKYKCIEMLPASMVHHISKVLEEIQVIYPNEQGMFHFVKWLLKGLDKEPLIIFSPICPDYSVEETGNPTCPFRHTFNELGAGLGLIAQRILASLPVITQFFKLYDFKVRFVIGIGDFEAYSEANLIRLNISREEFLDRVTKSKIAFEKASPVEVDVHMITNMFGGNHAWKTAYDEFIKKLFDTDFGASELNHKKLLQIVRKRKNLYDRWYGKKSLTEHIPQLLVQGAEYAALGAILSKSMENCLVLGADNDAMGSFYNVEQIIPTLYLKRFYC